MESGRVWHTVLNVKKLRIATKILTQLEEEEDLIKTTMLLKAQIWDIMVLDGIHRQGIKLAQYPSHGQRKLEVHEVYATQLKTTIKHRGGGWCWKIGPRHQKVLAPCGGQTLISTHCVSLFQLRYQCSRHFILEFKANLQKSNHNIGNMSMEFTHPSPPP